MQFSSFTFLWIFLPLALIVYYAIPVSASNLFLLPASLIFYAWGEPKYILLLLFTITINWICGISFQKCSKPDAVKAIISGGVILDLALLLLFKYSGFFAETVQTIFPSSNFSVKKIALPLGISFYTFQAISYLIDIYKQKAPVQKSWSKLALYISFFPKLTAGPIMEYADFYTQLSESRKKPSAEKLAENIRKFSYGLAKKVILADTLGYAVDTIMSKNPSSLGTLLCWTAAAFFTLQLYYDFSGYSDMAVGLAGMFGFLVKDNFNYPFLSKSIGEFWRKWHISLTNWFRDYVYIPLGGNRKGLFLTCINTMIVFLLSGLWHGASWNFVLWGAYYGIIVVLERIRIKYVSFPASKNNHSFLAASILPYLKTVPILIVGSLLFRSENLSTFWIMLKQMLFINRVESLWSIREIIGLRVLLLFILAILLSGIIQKIPANISLHVSETRRTVVSVIWAVFCLVLSIIYMANEVHNPFIYFQF